MRKPRILLDVDGVCADFVTPVLREINARMGTAFTPGDVTGWDIHGALGVPQDVRDAVGAAISAPGFCRDLEPYAGAREGVARLLEIAEVYIVTSPWDSDTWLREREKWVAEYLGIPRNRVWQGADKHVLGGRALIDDRTETLRAWRLEYPNQWWPGPVLFERPWNRLDSWDGSRARSWGELVETLEKTL